MFFRINLIWSGGKVDTFFYYALSLRKVIDHLIQRELINMTYDDLEKISDEDLEYKYLEQGVKWIKIKVVECIDVINLENGMKGKSKLSIPRKSIQETPFKNFIVKKETEKPKSNLFSGFGWY